VSAWVSEIPAPVSKTWRRQYAFKTLAYTMINLRHFCQR
jgi:hypothetical protein